MLDDLAAPRQGARFYAAAPDPGLSQRVMDTLAGLLDEGPVDPLDYTYALHAGPPQVSASADELPGDVRELFPRRHRSRPCGQPSLSTPNPCERPR